MKRKSIARIAGMIAVSAAALTALSASPAQAMKWDRGHISPNVIDCRSGVLCYNGDGTVNAEETLNQWGF